MDLSQSSEKEEEEEDKKQTNKKPKNPDRPVFLATHDVTADTDDGCGHAVGLVEDRVIAKDHVENEQYWPVEQ